jgi:hypothetical protein
MKLSLETFKTIRHGYDASKKWGYGPCSWLSRPSSWVWLGTLLNWLPYPSRNRICTKEHLDEIWSTLQWVAEFILSDWRHVGFLILINSLLAGSLGAGSQLLTSLTDLGGIQSGRTCNKPRIKSKIQPVDTFFEVVQLWQCDAERSLFANALAVEPPELQLACQDSPNKEFHGPYQL